MDTVESSLNVPVAKESKGKSLATIECENAIYAAVHKQGVFCCFEVTIGWFGEERVDFMTYDTKGAWRCYEVKVTKADFHSKAKKSFVGNYNYYVMPRNLYDQVKDEIPEGIGVYLVGENEIIHKVEAVCSVRAKKRALCVEENVLFASMVRSLSRYFDNAMRDSLPSVYKDMERKYKAEKTRADAQTKECNRLFMKLFWLEHPEFDRKLEKNENIDKEEGALNG